LAGALAITRRAESRGGAHGAVMSLEISKLSTTMDLYVQNYDEDLRGAVASLDRALGS